MVSSKSPHGWGRRAFRRGEPRESGDRLSDYNRDEFRRGWDNEAEHAAANPKPMVTFVDEANQIDQSVVQNIADLREALEWALPQLLFMGVAVPAKYARLIDMPALDDADEDEKD